MPRTFHRKQEERAQGRHRDVRKSKQTKLGNKTGPYWEIKKIPLVEAGLLRHARPTADRIRLQAQHPTPTTYSHSRHIFRELFQGFFGATR